MVLKAKNSVELKVKKDIKNVQDFKALKKMLKITKNIQDFKTLNAQNI
jgi:hypothetical protein